MFRVLFFVLIVFGLGFGFAWLADVPGDLVLTIANQEITVSLMVAGVAIVSIITLIMLIWWLVKVIFTSPQRMQRFFRARRRDRGYQSLSTGIIAAGAGDPATARKMLKQAGGLLNATTEPLIQLLDAQATMLEGKHDEARQKFEAMLEDPETRILGLRGLYMEAQRLGERDVQRHYAEKAAELAPQLSWASRAALDSKTVDGDWEGAIRLLDTQKSTKQITKEENNRKRAILLTAMSMENAESDPAKAKSAGLEAHRLAPEFAPAAVAAAEAAFRLNETRRGVKVLETTWRKKPHPDIALAYVNARAGETAQDRMKRAKRLEQLQPDNIESAFIMAKIALETGEFDVARKAAAKVLNVEPRESIYMLMADIEDAETGNQGKVREWMSRAVRAPRDAAWTADGYVSEKWAPFSPVTGNIDVFEWKVPVETLGGAMIENDLDPMEAGAMPVETVEAVPVVEEVPVVDVVEVEAPAEAEVAVEDTVAPAEAEPDNESEEAAEVAQSEDVKIPIPDDPGVPEGEEPVPSSRFRLF